MSKNIFLLLIGLLILSALACNLSSGGALPTVPPTARPTQAPARQPETPVPPTETSTAPATPPTEAPTTPPGAEEEHQRIRHLIRATVQIIALQEGPNGYQPLWTGSGTLVSPDGYILTNAHVATDPDPAYRPDALGIALTSHSDEPPELTYLAEVVALDPRLDLAVLRITTDLNGRPVDPASLNLAYVPLGDSDQLELGDRLRIFGYPGIGGETITLTEGSVSGFTRERGIEGRAYIKTDATIAGGNSGGLGANLAGELVGVPTQVGYGGAERFADCRYLADTNGDGRIDENDNCIPVGGFINALRPINLAKGLIEAARMGIARPTPQPSERPTGTPRFSRLLFAPDVTENDEPTAIVTQLPSGSTHIYLFFDYENMQDGLTWEARWYYNGEYDEGGSIPPGPWAGGESGTWWVAILNEQGLADGEYRVELYVEGEKLAEASIVVGGEGTGQPTFRNLTFAEGITDDGQPVNPGRLLPAGIQRVYAFFDYEGMRDGLAWSRTWYYEGEAVAEGSGTWDQGASGSTWVALDSREPLEPGSYRLELYIEGTMVAVADFTVAGEAGTSAFGPITFASGIDANDQPLNPGTRFPSGLEELYVFWEYTGMRDGMAWEERWLLDREELARFEATWQWGESGLFRDRIYRESGRPLDDGTYTLELYVEGELVQSGTAVIGSGAAPTPTPLPPTEGLFIQGTIVDADTERGIEGAAFIVLQPGVRTGEWDGDETQVYTWATTDRNGYFELPLPLERGQRYSIIVGAEGYTPLMEDDLLVSDEPSPLEVTIRLQRK